MRKAADIIRSRADEIAAVMTTEQGKPLVEAKGETLLAGDIIDWFAEEARRTYGRVIPTFCSDHDPGGKTDCDPRGSHRRRPVEHRR